ncbi:MAG TPA: ATP-binding cassette domain-containing protein [Longimicrobiales bacterium]|nr:ATP-binding cassette domain-containing protein [Longimicrobiales bacterium]
MIRLENLHKVLGGRVVLSDVDLEIECGEVVALVGPSGTGKSVLLRHVVGLLLPDRGDVRIDGQSVCHARYRELGRIRRRIGFVFQDAALLDSLTVRENLRLALDDRECRRNPVYAPNRITWALELVNLPDRVLDQLPGELSGGMRKRVGVARAVINAPDILLYDEPTTGLDPLNVSAINALINRSRDVLGATSVVVTHDMGSLAEIADRVAFLNHGTIAFMGTPAEFTASDDPNVQAFLRRETTSPTAAGPHTSMTEVTR